MRTSMRQTTSKTSANDMNTRKVHITWACTESAQSLSHSLMSGHMHFLAQVWVSSFVIHVHVRLSFISPLSSSTSICPSPSSPFSSLSCTSSCTLSSTTWSPCKTCATPRIRGGNDAYDVSVSLTLMTWRVMPTNVWNDIVSWQTRRLNDSTKYLLPASMTTTSKKKKQNLLENCHKYAPKLFWNVCIWHELDDLIFYGQDRLRNGPRPVTNAWIDWFHTFITHVKTQYCQVGNTVKQCRLGLFQDPDFAGDLEDSKSTSGGTLCIFGSHTYICSNKLDVQETNCRFSQFNRIWSHLFGRWIAIRRDFRSWFMGSDCCSPWTHDSEPWYNGCITSDLKEWSTFWVIWIVPSNVPFSHQEALLCVFLKTTKQWSRWFSREEVPQWDMFPEPTELLWIGCSIELIWTPKVEIWASHLFHTREQSPTRR